ncbi:SCP-like extracellular protein [Mesobacillus zeae]|uniref:SCP-like extracellular protein n=2 Tax=Mesobacillus zeae TaxID=1917180 RepID=A0A398B8S5_9BACI|nr:SCP-like extracellular protein [Mesobacillus zeae]
MDSGRYPQTKAVLIEEAKYQFVPCQPGEDTGAAQQAPPPVQPGSLQQDTGIGNQQGPKATEPGIGNQPAPAPAPAPAPTQPQTGTDNKANTSASKYVQQVIDLTNEQRTKNGLPALKGDAKLSSVAQKKSADMQQKGYFSHTSPTYGSPFDMMRDFGVSYRSAGENIAQGQQTPQEVVNAWMNSEGHRKNILSRDFTHIGVGYEAAGNYWTQMFIGK